MIPDDTDRFIRGMLVRPGRSLCRNAGVPYITYTIIHAQKPDIRSHTVPLDNINRSGYLEGMVTMNRTRNFHAYAGIGYRKTDLPPNRRGGKADVLALPALYIDIDNPDFDTVTERLSDVLRPTLLIASGGGFHAYWLLETPTRQLKRAGRILKGLASYLQSDGSMTVDQVMRVPGTINRKPERHCAPCEIVEGNWQRTYTLDDFYACEPPIAVQPGTPEQPAPPIVPRTSKQTGTRHPADDGYIPGRLISTITRYFRQQGGVMKRNGWMAVYCPYGHRTDRFPGDHAYWKPGKGVLHCFGDKHRDNTGTFDTARLLNIDTTPYTAFHRHEQTHTYTI